MHPRSPRCRSIALPHLGTRIAQTQERARSGMARRACGRQRSGYPRQFGGTWGAMTDDARSALAERFMAAWRGERRARSYKRSGAPGGAPVADTGPPSLPSRASDTPWLGRSHRICSRDVAMRGCVQNGEPQRASSRDSSTRTVGAPCYRRLRHRVELRSLRSAFRGLSSAQSAPRRHQMRQLCPCEKRRGFTSARRSTVHPRPLSLPKNAPQLRYSTIHVLQNPGSERTLMNCLSRLRARLA